MLGPKVSIVIPVYNGSNFLKEAIDSALNQTYKNIEIIVVNDGSNDNGATEEIAKSYGNKIRYYSKENGGVASALNLGIKKMTGDYFSWLSHDDLYEKTKIEEQVNYLNKFDREDAIIACNAKVLFANGIKKKEKIDANTFNFIDIFLSTSANIGVNGCSLLIPKKAFEVCGDFNVNLPVTQDYDLWFRMKDKYSFVLLDKYLVISRRHAEQDSVSRGSLMHDHVDKLHYNFLLTITYKRFEEYFKYNKTNTSNYFANYKTYKSRGYIKTSSLMLKILIRYYYENDRNKFYDIFRSEINIDKVPMNNRAAELSQAELDLEYNRLVKSGRDEAPINLRPFVEKPFSKHKPIRIIKKISNSVLQDGLVFTIDKSVRKIYKNIK